MKAGRVANAGLPFVEGFSTKEREVAEKSLARLSAQQIKSAETRARKAEKILETFQGKFHDLLGAKKSATLRAAIASERLAFRELWSPPEGLQRNYNKEREASRLRIAKLAAKLGASSSKAKRLRATCNEQLVAVFSATDGKLTAGFDVAKNFEKWSTLTPFHKFPLPWVIGLPPLDPDPNDPHRWFLFQPPFFGFLFGRDFITTSNFTVDWEHVLVPSVGQVGNKASMDCHDASSFDAAHMISESQIAFGFVPPTTGIVEVVIDAICTVDSHFLKIKDEFGGSDAWCGQTNQLMMNVLHPNVPQPSIADMAHMFEETDGDNLTASQELLTRGRHFSAQLFSSGPVPAGQSVVITAGARTFDIARANDMELESRSDCQWFISSVEVRITP